MASSSSKRRRSYDVFLSFRGTDVRNNFLGHLYTALDQRGINTFMDSEELRKGEQISPTLMEAIEESRIAIVVFSEDYASSSWCLEELAKIMECKEQRDLMVFPLFYKVEPREVRTPGHGKGERQSYGEAMAAHEVNLGKDSEKVKKWKKALFGAGSLSGWHFTDGFEARLIQHMVQEISTNVDKTPLDVAKYPTGIDSRVQELKAILNLQSKDDVFMVGLWGQGGVGKTTLAKAIYNIMFREFQGCSFLERVREKSKSSSGLVALQENLLLEVLLGKKFTIYSVARGSYLIQDRLRYKKVFIILDDVDDACQLNALAGNCQWFGDGSRIIITTRDKHLLTSHGVHLDHMYEVQALENGAALELFRKHILQGNQEIEISSNLVDRVLHYANGLPLALEVLGSSLCGRGEHEWKSTLQKLAKSPDKKINDVLKVSYYGLEDYAKEIFLDISCFFKGQDTNYIKKILDSCDFDTTIGVKNLMERSLISEEHGTLQMHDLIQSMGMDIVKEECRDDPEKRSRLWLHDDVLDVLFGNLGTTAIKAIVLELPKPGEMFIGPDAFTNMRKLRLLILRNVHNPFQGPIHIPNELRWFEWPHCASIPEFSDGQKKLVGVDLPNTNVEGVLKKFKDFKKLKFINFSGCQSLVCMPNLDCTPNLEELDLSECKNLEHAHKSVAYHGKLQLLNLSGCSKLLHLPDVIHCKNLRLLNLANCSKLLRFPISPNKTTGLRELNLKGTSIEELPASIENLVSLKRMDLTDCKKLSVLPSSIYRLQNLETLLLGGCSRLGKFPKKEDSSDPHMKMGFSKLQFLVLQECNLSEAEFLKNPSCFSSLVYLYLRENSFTTLPSCRHLYNLECLDVGSCDQLQEILEIPEQLKSLSADGCKSLSKIPFDIGHVDSINLHSCHELVSNGSAIYDLFKLEHACPGNRFVDVALPEGEMPEWLLPNNDGHISFMASKDLLKKFLGLVFCIVFQAKGGKEDVSFQLTHSTNSEWRGSSYHYFSSDSDNAWLKCCKTQDLWQVDAFGPNDWRCFQFTIKASASGIVKKCGFQLICKPLEDDLEDFLQHNQLLNPALLYEVEHEESQMSTVEESLSDTKELQDGKTSTEEDSSSKLVLTKLDKAGFSFVVPPNGCFQFTIKASAIGTVNNCGFRPKCNALENDVEDFLQHNQLLRLALLFKVGHEESQTSTVEESSSETKELQDSKTRTEEDSSSKLVHTESNMADFSIEKFRYSLIHPDYRSVRPGEDMPEKFVLVEDGTISFMASQNLYDKFLGLALCAIFGVEDGKKEVSFDIVPYVNGLKRNGLSGTLGSFDSDHMWIQYVKSNVLWGLIEGGVDFNQFDKSYLRFSLQLKVSGGTLKKLGYVIRCRQLEDDLKVVLEDNQLVNLASLCEDFDEPVDSRFDPPPRRRPPLPREYLRKCHMHIEELEASDRETDQAGSGECSRKIYEGLLLLDSFVNT